MQKPFILLEPVVKIYEEVIKNSANIEDLIEFILSSRYTPFPDKEKIGEKEKQEYKLKLVWIIIYYSLDYLKAEEYFKKICKRNKNRIAQGYYNKVEYYHKDLWKLFEQTYNLSGWRWYPISVLLYKIKNGLPTKRY